ncbi:hypothetical protein CRG98_030407 [Punica granatum]|uniref:Uncharacterized protein n=1 Tax=Punica granatum TaxID=22663 RepID=A0A2I0IYX0_PUNGR|nr:hypothetical protein CRG98_030407 [Punica granatum]
MGCCVQTTFVSGNLACAAVLGKARGAGSHEDSRRRRQRTSEIHSLIGGMTVLVDRPSGHSSSGRRGRVKAASGLPAKVGTTRLSCGVGGRDGRPLVIAYLAMEK